MDRPLRNYQKSQSAENPLFEPPASNVSTLDSGSIWVNGQEIFWRYFFPNTSIIQPLNFRFSFEIWWKIPDVGIEIVVDLSENEGESRAAIVFEEWVVENHPQIYSRILEYQLTQDKNVFTNQWEIYLGLS